MVDLVETGTTMRAAGLEEVAVILKTEASLIANKNSKHSQIIDLFKARVEGYLTATRYMMITYNISREKLAEALEVCWPSNKIFDFCILNPTSPLGINSDYSWEKVSNCVAPRGRWMVCC